MSWECAIFHPRGQKQPWEKDVKDPIEPQPLPKVGTCP